MIQITFTNVLHDSYDYYINLLKDIILPIDLQIVYRKNRKIITKVIATSPEYVLKHLTQLNFEVLVKGVDGQLEMIIAIPNEKYGIKRTK